MHCATLAAQRTCQAAALAARDLMIPASPSVPSVTPPMRRQVLPAFSMEASTGAGLAGPPAANQLLEPSATPSRAAGRPGRWHSALHIEIPDTATTPDGDWPRHADSSSCRSSSSSSSTPPPVPRHAHVCKATQGHVPCGLLAAAPSSYHLPGPALQLQLPDATTAEPPSPLHRPGATSYPLAPLAPAPLFEAGITAATMLWAEAAAGMAPSQSSCSHLGRLSLPSPLSLADLSHAPSAAPGSGDWSSITTPGAPRPVPGPAGVPSPPFAHAGQQVEAALLALQA
jgi:hypothetical protein